MKTIDKDEYFMTLALKQAKKASSMGEVPVGAVITRNNKVISLAFNTRETEKNALSHAELKAIRNACEKLGGWRLFDCDLYVTLEPCPMCAGAIINSRISRVIFGTRDEKSGAVVSRETMFDKGYNHKPAVKEGVLGAECAALLSDFFAELRKNRANKRKWCKNKRKN